MPTRGSVAWAILLSLCAGAAFPEDDKGIRREPIRDRQGNEVTWYEGSHALLIGVSDYSDAAWPDLDNISAELTEVRQELEAHGFGVELAPQSPTAEQLEDTVESFLDEYGYGARNRLLIFYSGHGFSFKDDNRGYLVPSDAPSPFDDRLGFLRKALPMSQILAWSKEIYAAHVLFLFDSCFSGTIFKAKSLPEVPPHIASVTAKPVRQFISAGNAGQVVPAKSVFTPHFARALRGQADLDRDGYVTGTELGMYLHKSVVSYRQGQEPQYGKILDPDFNEGDFVFRLPRRTPAAPQLAAPPDESPTITDLLDQAAKIEKIKARWAERLSAQRKQFADADAFENRDVPASLKAEAWQRLVDGYAQDDPYSSEDDLLRKHAGERLAHWREAASALSKMKDQSVTTPPPMPLRIPDGGAADGDPRVSFDTPKGRILIKLHPDKAPKTVENFLAYVRSGFYDGTIFHRVIPRFMVQGGGFTADMQKKETRAPIENEADNGLKNLRGTLSMARTGDPHSATVQFFLNVVDNRTLDHTGKTRSGWGYAVFATVIEGMDVADAIAAVPTTHHGRMRDVPKEAVTISKASVVKAE